MFKNFSLGKRHFAPLAGLAFGLSLVVGHSDAFAARSVRMPARKGYSIDGASTCTGAGCSLDQANRCYWEASGDPPGSLRRVSGGGCGAGGAWLMDVPIETTTATKTVAASMHGNAGASGDGFIDWYSFTADGTMYSSGGCSSFTTGNFVSTCSISSPAAGYAFIYAYALDSTLRIDNFQYQYDCSTGAAC